LPFQILFSNFWISAQISSSGKASKTTRTGQG
jgi:hypothetical protein